MVSQEEINIRVSQIKELGFSQVYKSKPVIYTNRAGHDLEAMDIFTLNTMSWNRLVRSINKIH